MIRFRLYGIPVEIQPFFWVTTALLGGALGANSPDSIISVVIFIAAAFVSILIHELGHATVGMKYGGGRAHIQLNAFGGLAFNEDARLHRDHRFWMIAAGPGAGFGFLIVILAGLSLAFNSSDVLDFSAWYLFGKSPSFHTADLMMFLRDNPMIRILLGDLLWINFWWGLINLLPVLPLDGGLIADLYVRPQRRVYLIGTIAAGAMAAAGYLWLHSMYPVVLFGFLAWQNYQNMRSVLWQ